MEENKAIIQEIWNTSILYPKTTKEFYHHIKVKWTESVIHKKAVLKNFVIFTRKHLCWNLFFNKNAGLQVPSFIKKRLEHSCLFANIEKLLRKPILKSICERLLLRVSYELFPTWTNNIGYEENVFSKIKQNKNRTKTQLYEETFDDVHFVFLFFSTSRQTAFALHNKR